MKWTTCKKCNRVLWEKDADKNGLCVDCRPTMEDERRPEKVKDKKKDD